jgi:hypothetical protein
MWSEVICSIILIVLLYIIGRESAETTFRQMRITHWNRLEDSSSTTTEFPTATTTISECVLKNGEDSDDGPESGTTAPIVIALPRLSLDDIKKLQRIAMGVDSRSYLWMLDSGKDDPAVFRKHRTIPDGFSENATLLTSEDLSAGSISTILDSSVNLTRDKMQHMKAILREALHQVLNHPTSM